jgi:DNA-binding NarL/FixJ family response regulator
VTGPVPRRRKAVDRARTGDAIKRSQRVDGVHLFRMGFDGEELVVLSAPADGEPPEGLSAAELDVALAIARGASNAEIAAARGTSARTVANQVASIFKRLGVSSRVQVAAAMSGRRARS